MINRKNRALALLGTVALAGVAFVASAPAALADPAAHATPRLAAWDFDGCPDGAVCIYRDDDPDHLSGAYITDTYWSYGSHNLAYQEGGHYVLNNQVGGDNATVDLCTGYDGTGSVIDTIPPSTARPENLTPVNSIVLNRP